MIPKEKRLKVGDIVKFHKDKEIGYIVMDTSDGVFLLGLDGYSTIEYYGGLKSTDELEVALLVKYPPYDVYDSKKYGLYLKELRNDEHIKVVNNDDLMRVNRHRFDWFN